MKVNALINKGGLSIFSFVIGFSFVFTHLPADAGKKDLKVVTLTKDISSTKTDTDIIYVQKGNISTAMVDALFRDQGAPVVAQLPQQLQIAKTTSWHKIAAPVDFKCDQLLTESGMKSLYGGTTFKKSASTSDWKHFDAVYDPPIGKNVSIEYLANCGASSPDLLKKAFNTSEGEVAYFSHINFNYSDYFDVFVFYISVSMKDGVAKVETSAVFSYKDGISGFTKGLIEGKAGSTISDIINSLIPIASSGLKTGGNSSPR